MRFKKAVWFLMLVISSLGAIPYWLHHAASHDCCSLATQCSEVDEEACCSSCCEASAKVAEGGSDESTEDPEISAGHHDCFVCFNLSQSVNHARTTFELSSTAHFERPASDYQSSSSPLRTLPPARGPPIA